MSKMNRTFVLGAEDPEMSTIANLLSIAGEKWEVARTADGVRVNPGTAYKAISPTPAPGQVWVECAAGWQRAADAPAGVTVVDHHRAGDPGFGGEPQKFWESSSVGQVFNLLRGRRSFVPVSGKFPQELAPDSWPNCGYNACGEQWPVAVQADGQIMTACHCDGSGWPVASGYSLKLRLVAAADHCLAAAYAGKCPGVDREQLFAAWLEASSARSKISVAELRASVEAAIVKLASAPTEPTLGVADLREAGFIPQLVAAATITGQAYLTTIVDRDSRDKVVIGGCGEGSAPGTEPIRIFKETWATTLGLVEIYGDPVRGFAGGYLPK